MREIFVCLEGLDGCGKSTQSKAISRWLNSIGKKVLLTAEPTNGPVGRLLREMIKGRVKFSPLTEAMLFAADRNQHLEEEVKPALADGKIVICERYIHSSLAYQPARGVPEEVVRELNKHFQRPDLVILLDIPVEVAMKRMRGKKLDRFEADREFQERVRENYLRLFRREGLPILDACQEPARLEEEIRKLIAPLLSKR
ncbi:MAG: dTMP kinase [Candidatus Hadarchaeales archaeon]